MAEETQTQAPQEKELLSWESGARPFKRRDRDTYVTIIAVAALFGIILFIIQGIMPVLLIVSLLFLFYILSTVEPERVTYKITDSGIQINEKLTHWGELTRFWFTHRLDHTMLIMETTFLPGRLEIIIDSESKDKIKKVLKDYIPNEESPPSLFDKASNLTSKFIR
jgi:hypothetical protein